MKILRSFSIEFHTVVAVTSQKVLDYAFPIAQFHKVALLVHIERGMLHSGAFWKQLSLFLGKAKKRKPSQAVILSEVIGPKRTARHLMLRKLDRQTVQRDCSKKTAPQVQQTSCRSTRVRSCWNIVRYPDPKPEVGTPGSGLRCYRNHLKILFRQCCKLVVRTLLRSGWGTIGPLRSQQWRGQGLHVRTKHLKILLPQQHGFAPQLPLGFTKQTCKRRDPENCTNQQL